MKGSRMNCWHCKAELIWGSDVDLEDVEGFVMETFLSYPKCGSQVSVLYPETNEEGQ